MALAAPWRPARLSIEAPSSKIGRLSPFRKRSAPVRGAGSRARLRSEQDYPPRVRPRVHRREGLVDLLQPVRVRHQRVELQLSGAVEREEARDVAMHVRAAVPAAEEAFLEERQEKQIQRDGFLD